MDENPTPGPAPAPPGQPAGGTDSNPTPPFIPNEIMSMIVNQLRLPIHGLPFRLFEREYKERRAALRNLCLTAKFLEVYARPLLYETVIFFPESETHNYNFGDVPSRLVPMILLIRTLLEKPGHCGWIKNIVYPSGFGQHKWFGLHHRNCAEAIYRWPFLSFDYPS
ncbi:hypothetical protein F5Y13DRAFT_101381 [Hypoxylon sp. FL1857]|nr:hypothetical protein F5Y13DRAFT_101381 [Hypoxylon sp. FL1857]